MSLPRFAIEHRAIVVTAVFITSVWGLIAFITSPRREDPEFTIRDCVIATEWPGAGAEKVEQLITDPIERAADALDEVAKVTSVSRVGLSTVFVSVEQKIEDVDAVWDKVRAKMDEVRPELPEGASEPWVDTEYGDTSAMVLAVYQKPAAGGGAPSRRYTPRELELMAKRVKDELKLLRAVGRVDLLGVQREAIYVETDAGTWSRLSLTTAELRQLLQERNIVAPGGAIETEWGRFGLKPTGELGSVEQLGKVVVDAEGGRAPVYLRDLELRISRRYEEPPSFITRLGSASGSVPCVVASFTMKRGENIVRLGREVRRKLAELEAAVLPRDIGIAVVADQPEAVATCIDEFTSNLWQAIVIVVLVAFLLIGFRIALVMAAAIPMVILVSFAIVRLFGVQLEQVSIASLIIALGMLVDNAIEVGDNVHRLLSEGRSRIDAAVEGSEQIAFPVLIATLTTVAAFLPMVTLPGEEGEYMFSLPVVVSTTLLVSWFLAMTITTLMAYWQLRPPAGDGHSAPPLLHLVRLVGRLCSRTDGPGFDAARISAVYAALLRSCLRRKFVTLGIAVLAFAGSCALVPLIGSQFFPPAERGQFTIDVWLPEGATVAQTDAACRRLEDLIRELSPVEREGAGVERLVNMVTYVGQGGPRFYLNLNPEQECTNYAQIVVNTLDPEATFSYVRDLRHAAAARIDGARIVPRLLDLGTGLDSPIGVRISGRDLDALRGLANRLKDALRRVPGTVDVHDTWGSQGYELGVEIDEDKANLAGVTNASVARTLKAFFSGFYLTTYREGDHRVPVYLRLPARQRRSLTALKSIYVEGLHGKVPLDAVARLEPKWRPAKICRWKLQRMIEVRARVEEGLLANTVLALALPEIEAARQTLPPGYRIELGGEQEETVNSQKNMAKALGVSVLLIVMCLVVQYNSFAKPLIILLTLPMAATGAFLGLFITGCPLGFMAMLGMLSLAGIVLNDAIVLTEFIEVLMKERHARQEGLPGPDERSCGGLSGVAFRDCLVRAGQMRMLPIVLTTLTTVGGLIPLAFSGGPLWAPMAFVIIFGLLLATLLTLVIIPTVFAVFVEDFGMEVIREGESAAA